MQQLLTTSHLHSLSATAAAEKPESSSVCQDDEEPALLLKPDFVIEPRTEFNFYGGA